MEDNYLIAKRIFSTHADTYRARFWDVSRYAATLLRFAASLPSGARVLELGCGPGNVTSVFLLERPDLKICATDFSPEMVALAQREHPSLETLLLDVRDLSRIDRTFEGIAAGFVLPYINEEDTRRFLEEASRRLVPGGLFYLSTMVENATQRSGIRTNSAGDTIYMYYHSASNLLRWVAQAGFTVTLQTLDFYPAGDGTVTSDMALVARLS